MTESVLSAVDREALERSVAPMLAWMPTGLSKCKRKLEQDGWEATATFCSYFFADGRAAGVSGRHFFGLHCTRWY